LDSDKKKHLLKNWISYYLEDYLIDIAVEGQRITRNMIVESIAKQSSNITESKEYIYLLCIYEGNKLIPVYIGKSTNPLIRWKNHQVKWLSGKGTYFNWKNLLITENEMAKYTLKLLIIPENEIINPPIPNFPNTVGSIEYQLISLVSDAYPKTLLNKEGNRR
jgi:hypothetical protein